MVPRHHHTKASWRLPVSATIKRIRKALGWSPERFATEMGLTSVGWRSVESGRYEVPVHTIERIREVTGLDPYVCAYLSHYDYSRLPPRIQELLTELRKEWDSYLEIAEKARHRLPGAW